jgi:hypothetical protein
VVCRVDFSSEIVAGSPAVRSPQRSR